MKVDLHTQLCIWASQHGLPNPKTEHKFHPDRKWAMDFAWPDLKLAVEYEGLKHGHEAGRHQRPKGYSDDCEKYNGATILGWIVIRVTSMNVALLLTWLDEALALRNQLDSARS